MGAKYRSDEAEIKKKGRKTFLINFCSFMLLLCFGRGYRSGLCFVYFPRAFGCLALLDFWVSWWLLNVWDESDKNWTCRKVEIVMQTLRNASKFHRVKEAQWGLRGSLRIINRTKFIFTKKNVSAGFVCLTDCALLYLNGKINLSSLFASTFVLCWGALRSPNDDLNSYIEISPFSLAFFCLFAETI